jgi:hypothetical protein
MLPIFSKVQNTPKFLRKSQGSNIETTFYMVKSKFGHRLRSKPYAQINEAPCQGAMYVRLATHRLLSVLVWLPPSSPIDSLSFR